MQYRAEVDGLRALAVLPVIAYHAGVDSLAGGFVGVDVFFVISGYLITSIIAAEIAEGRFSLVTFYERRARRILPALMLVSLVAVPFAGKWMLPHEFQEFGQSLVAVNLFSSNILFWLKSDYFSASAELMPLLHTWSLAVEEQFYLFFPLLLLALRRTPTGRVLVVLALIAVVSFALTFLLAAVAPMANFYLLPSRAWELMVGAFLALTARQWLPWQGVGNQLGALLGLGLITYACLAFDHHTVFPGPATLVPVLGTALVILCARADNLAGRVLAWRPMVMVGLISYSAYLWHQPLFAFARIRLLGEVSPGLYGLLSLASLVLAYVSWRYVERPFRQRQRIGRARIFQMAAVASAAFIAFGLAGHLSRGFAEPDNLSVRLAHNFGLGPQCEGDLLLPQCQTTESPTVMVWGDSYSMHLVAGVVDATEGGVIQFTKSSCAPFLGIAPIEGQYTAQWARGCVAFNDAVAEWVQDNDSVKVAVISSPFLKYLTNRRFLAEQGPRQLEYPEVLGFFEATLDFLRGQGITPLVVAPPPRDGRDLGLCVARSLDYGEDPARCDFALADANEKYRVAEAFLKDVESRVSVLWLDRAICPQGQCSPLQQGTIIYRDGGHLSYEGSAFVARALALERVMEALMASEGNALVGLSPVP